MAHSKSMRHGQPWKWETPTNCPMALRYIVSALNQSREYVKRAVVGIDYDALWKRFNDNAPSMGNILMHLRGTEHQWIGNKVGKRPLQRDRDLEFSTRNGDPLELLLQNLDATERETSAVLEQLDAVDENILYCFHYTENHFAFHAGQLCTMRKIHEPEFLLYP